MMLRRVTKSPHFIGTFAMRQNLARLASRRRDLSPRVLSDVVSHWRRRGGARHLHTKLSGVTVIFFLL
jgi:hypothetical protein